MVELLSVLHLFIKGVCHANVGLVVSSFTDMFKTEISQQQSAYTDIHGPWSIHDSEVESSQIVPQAYPAVDIFTNY